MNKKVSIIIPVYNGSNYLKEAIDSALNQSYKNIEVLVINDGSCDDGKTRDIALSYGDKIRYFEKKNGGVSTALNLGIEKMTGDYFSWLSHDDKYKKDKILLQMKYLEDNHLIGKNVILYTDYDMIDKKSKYMWTEKFDSEISNQKQEFAILRGQINGITLLIPKKAFVDCGVFDENLRCVQDYELWWKMIKKYQFIHLSQNESESRIHPRQVTNRSPRVASEGNEWWIKIIKDISKKNMIRLEGSVYAFYKEMEKFLASRSYDKALLYCREKALKIESDSKNRKDVLEYQERKVVVEPKVKKGPIKTVLMSIHTSGFKSTLKKIFIKIKTKVKK